MSEPITSLQPTLLWKHFHGLTQVPRPSKKEGKILDHLKRLVADLGYTAEQDATGNLLVRKPASAGCEHAPTVVIQGHIDMVCEKNKGTEHDFDNDPIRAYVDGDWVTADGTTLGADNGIGVAAALAVLESKDLVHPPLELLFTVDEETGLTGAKGLQPGFLTGSIMLNLDSEEDGALYVGCSGGMDTAGVMPLTMEPTPADWAAIDIQIGGLKGGHSGLDIHTGRGNAIKILTRIIDAIGRVGDVRIATIAGGSKRNAIPREAEAVVCVPAAVLDDAIAVVNGFNDILMIEISNVEPGIAVTAKAVTVPASVIASTQCTTLLDTLYSLPHGVLKMSADLEGLVETSTNLATLTMENGRLVIGTSQRSSVESEKLDAVRMVSAVLKLAGLEIVYGDGYPGWKPNMQSFILQRTMDTYNQLHGEEPLIKAIHAGLECGLIGEVYPKMDMISFGPTIEGAHSPDERLHIRTTAKFWTLLTTLLENIARSK